jgi:hypothetical protein
VHWLMSIFSLNLASLDGGPPDSREVDIVDRWWGGTKGGEGGKGGGLSEKKPAG